MSYGDQFATVLQRLIEEKIDFLTEQLKTGSINTIEEYKEKTGQIRGLQSAIEFFDEAKTVLQQR